MPEILVIISVSAELDEPTSATGLSRANAETLEEAINGIPGLAVEVMRPTGPVMPVMPGGNTRVDFRAP